MIITNSIKLILWPAPDSVQVEQKPGKREDGIQKTMSIPVADLSQSTLDGLALAWLTELYQKAEKPMPSKWSARGEEN